jgi:hypothetical protein
MPQTGLEGGMEGFGTPPGTPSDLRPSPWGSPGPLQRGSRGGPRCLSGGVPDGSPKGFPTNTKGFPDKHHKGSKEVPRQPADATMQTVKWVRHQKSSIPPLAGARCHALGAGPAPCRALGAGPAPCCAFDILLCRSCTFPSGRLYVVVFVSRLLLVGWLGCCVERLQQAADDSPCKAPSTMPQAQFGIPEMQCTVVQPLQVAGH